MRENQQLIGDLMLETGLITRAELNAALDVQAKSGSLLGEILISMGLFGEEALRWALARQLDVPLIHPDPKALDPAALELIPAERCRRYGILPITLLPEDDDPNPVLTLAAADPSDQTILEDVRRSVPYKVHVVAALREEIMKCLDRLYGAAPATFEHDKGDDSTRSDPTGMKLLAKLIDSMSASNARTLRIFGKSGVTVCRDGDGRTLFTGGHEWLGVLAERARILASMSGDPVATERRGRMLFADQSGKTQLIRVVALSTMAGEEIHLRAILDENKTRTLEEMGFTQRQAEAVRAAVSTPGLVLVSTPGGDGLISTLYSLMREAGEGGKRVAIEAEVVYRSEDTAQIECASQTETARLLSDFRHMEFDRVLVGQAERSLLPELLALARRRRRVYAGLEEAGMDAVMALLADQAKRSSLLGLAMVISLKLIPLAGEADRYAAKYEVLKVDAELLELLGTDAEKAASAAQAKII